MSEHGRRMEQLEPELLAASDVESDAPAFCSLTFGQFFTMLVLLLVTVCGAFYLGARYGNEYLRLDRDSSARLRNDDAVQELPDSSRNTADTLQLARAALQRQQQKTLEAQVNQYLQNPATAPLGMTPPMNAAVVAAAPRSVAPAIGAQGAVPSSVQAPSTTGVNPLVAAAAETPYVPTAARPATVVESTQPELVQAGANERVLSPNSASPAVALQGAAGLPFAVQVAAFRDIREAQARVNSWQSKGYSAYLTEADLAEQGKWYRVRLGAFATRQEASDYLNVLQQKETVDALIVGH